MLQPVHLLFELGHQRFDGLRAFVGFGAHALHHAPQHVDHHQHVAVVLGLSLRGLVAQPREQVFTGVRERENLRQRQVARRSLDGVHVAEDLREEVRGRGALLGVQQETLDARESFQRLFDEDSQDFLVSLWGARITHDVPSLFEVQPHHDHQRSSRD